LKLKFITPIKDSLNQVITLNLEIGKETKRVRLSLIYQEKTNLWYMSLSDVQTEEEYLSNVPLLSSGTNANNLWEPFYYKRVGLLFCYPKSDSPSTPNPSKDNLDEFYIVWSDGIV